MGFLWSLISRRTKLVIEAEKFSLPSETEFFNTIDPHRSLAINICMALIVATWMSVNLGAR